MTLQLLSFVNKHYRDIVSDRITKFTSVANQAVPGFVRSDVPFAFGTDEYLKQFIANCHLLDSLTVYLEYSNYTTGISLIEADAAHRLIRLYTTGISLIEADAAHRLIRL